MLGSEIEFPIEGYNADVLLIMEVIICFLSLELALVFLVKVLRNKNQVKKLQEKAYVWIFLGFSIMWVFFILGDYYAEVTTSRLIFLELGYLSQGCGALVFIRIIEEYKTFIKKYLFSIAFFSYLIFFSIFSIINIKIAQGFSFFFWPIFLLFFLFYSKALSSIFKKNPILGDYKYSLLKLFLGIILFIIGFGLTTDFVIDLFGLEVRLVGDILQIIANIFLYLFFSSIPSFSEYDWQEKIDSVYIIHKSGILIYKKSFQQEESEFYDSITSGLITMLKMMLETVSNRETSSFIEEKGKIVLIQPGEFIYGVLISEERLNSLEILLHNFITTLEYTYADILKDWDGKLKVFRPVDRMAKDIFR